MLALINVGLSNELISYFGPTTVKALRFKSDSALTMLCRCWLDNRKSTRLAKHSIWAVSKGSPLEIFVGPCRMWNNLWGETNPLNKSRELSSSSYNYARLLNAYSVAVWPSLIENLHANVRTFATEHKQRYFSFNRRNFFSIRIVNMWNSLPAETTDFSGLDKFNKSASNMFLLNFCQVNFVRMSPCDTETNFVCFLCFTCMRILFWIITVL